MNGQLTVEGKAGTKFDVYVRDRGDEPPPPLFSGEIGPEGRLTFAVPLAYLVIVGADFESLPVHLEAGQKTQAVRLVYAD